METGLTGLNEIEIKGAPDKSAIIGALARPTPDRILVIAQAFRHGLSVEEIAHASKYEPWFLRQIEQLVDVEAVLRKDGLPEGRQGLLELKKKGFSDDRLGELAGLSAAEVAKRRRALGVRPVYKRIDTCAAEFESHTPYLYSCYEGDGVIPANARPSRATGGRSSSWAAGPTASARASSSTIAASTPSTRCARPATRPSWSTAIPRPCRPTTTPPTASTSSR